MTTLEDLYYGNIAPYERYIRHGNGRRNVILFCRGAVKTCIAENKKTVFSKTAEIFT